MSQISEIDLPAEYAEDWIPAPESRLESQFTTVTVVTDEDVNPEEVGITSPNGTRVRITVDPITGGLRITQHQDEERGLLTVAPVAVGVLVLDDRA